MLQTWNYTNKITLVYNERSIKVLEYDSTMVVSFKCLQTISKFVEGFESICRDDGQLSLAWSLFWILLVIRIGKYQSSFTDMLWNVQIGPKKTPPLLNKYYWNEGTLNRDKIPLMLFYFHSKYPHFNSNNLGRGRIHSKIDVVALQECIEVGTPI